MEATGNAGLTFPLCLSSPFPPAPLSTCHVPAMRFGMSEKTILRTFHPDAEDLFNVTCDLKGLCFKLSDRAQRTKRQASAVLRVHLCFECASESTSVRASGSAVHLFQVTSDLTCLCYKIRDREQRAKRQVS